MRIRQRLRIGPNGIPQWLGELLAIVENADAVAIQVLCHPGRVAQGLQVATDDDAVVAVQYTIDLAGVLLIERDNTHPVTSFGTGMVTLYIKPYRWRQVGAFLVLACPG